MPVEAAVYLDTLNPSNPTGAEKAGQGDDHLRLLKRVLQATFPAIAGAVTLTNAVINALPTRIKVFEDNFTVSGVVKLAAALDANSKRITNLADPVSAQDADTKLARDTAITAAVAAMFPVGSVYLTFVSTNPATLLGFGTWSQVAQGELLVGVGTKADQNAFSKTFAAGDNAGEFRHTLAYSDIPTGDFVTYVNSQGVGVNSDGGLNLLNGSNRGLEVDYNDDVTQTPFNVTPPTYGVYVWRRTA